MKTGKLWWLAPPLLFAAVVPFLWPRGTALVIDDASGRRLFAKTMRKGDFFSIAFTHSVAKSRVEEVFEITGGDEFRLRETLYADFGAGLPHEEMPGQHMEFSDGRIKLDGYDSKFNELRLRVGHIANHQLELSDEAPLPLARLASPGSELRVAVISYPLGFLKTR